jgi:chromosome segregation protein
LERIAALEVELAAAASAAADEAHIAACDARLAELADATDTSARDATSARGESERVQLRLGEAATRLDVLRRLQESGAGLHGGPRDVLAAGRDGRLDGILGAVAELLEAPKALEIAIEAALGARLQDVVVATWTDAEAAIAHLKRSGAGRATFQPLDTIRAGRDSIPAQIATQHAGVLGVAADLIATSPGVAPVAAALLGRTLVVEDLATARGVLRHLSSGWSVVTTTGEIARVGGAVTGGSAVRESGALARERELRELPGAVARLEIQLTEARRQVATADSAARAAVDAQRAAAEERARLEAAATARQQQHERLASWLADLQSEQAGSERRAAMLEADQQRIAAELHELGLEQSRLAATRDHAARDRDDAEEERAALATEALQRDRTAAEDGRRLAGLEERLRGERRREAGLRAQEHALSAELALRAERTATLDRERAALAADHARLCNDVTATTAELAAASDAREPLRMEAMGAEIAAGRLAESLQAARSHLVDRDRERDHADFALERAVQERDAVWRRIRDDLEIENPDEVLAWSPSSAPSAPEAREAEIARLWERLRRVGYAGEDAVADYEREAAHQAFLREQLADVEGAAAALRDLLAGLRQTMRARFDATFARVAEAFADAFTTLFGGGTAKLVLITGDNGAEPGIDIIAQPPGKRLQSLAQLSGGERALTAAALLFAILKVNPVPFCLLDEVDAALDEANIVRFREQLQALAARTQVIVVTHNRGTIEIADTLYGVSMAADGVSQVLSLRLTESLPAD